MQTRTRSYVYPLKHSVQKDCSGLLTSCITEPKESRNYCKYFYKITRIVRALWLVERRVCMRVCKHGCEVKMFCFSHANHASTNLKKVSSWKNRQVYFIYQFPRRLKLEKSLETCCVNFFFAWADILSEKNPYFGKHLFCKTKTDYAYKVSVQDFATGKNFSFNHCSKQESFAFFSGKLFYKSKRKLFFLCLHILI